MKVPHLRNMYQKVGMFGMAKTPGFIFPESDDPNIDNAFMGEQVRGFGFFHDGSIDTVFRFAIGPEGDVQRRQVEQYVLAFDNNLAPIVGQQLTLRQDNTDAMAARLHLFMARAEQGECDLVVKGRRGRSEAGYLYVGSGRFRGNQSEQAPVSLAELKAQARRGHGALTFTCAPPGAGLRLALDRDLDGRLDGDPGDARRATTAGKHGPARMGFVRLRASADRGK